MAWDENGNRYPQRFKSHQESYQACQYTWKRSYGRLPDLDLATKYTGGDDTATWLTNFYAEYNRL